MRTDIDKLFINSKTKIIEAMQNITNTGMIGLPAGIAVIVNESKQIVGVVTDGDIRKSLVKGIKYDDHVEKIMTRDPIMVDEDMSNEEMIKTVINKVRNIERIKNYRVNNIIVINKNRNVVDVLDYYDLWYKQDTKLKKVCIIGSGFIGLTLSISIAETGFSVICYDINKELIDKLNNGEVDFYEKGVSPLLKFHLKNKNIAFTSKISDINADIYVVCVGTPIDEKTNEPILDYLLKAIEDLGNIIKKEDLIILRSTVPVGTTRNIFIPGLESKSKLKAGKDFYISFVPERVIEGNALEEIKEIPQAIGSFNKRSLQETIRFYQTFNTSIVTLDSLEEAELIKLINNCFRDLSFAFANKIVLLSEKLNLDAVKIIKSANEGYPRNPIPLPSPGVGGYCLTKDPYLMVDVFKKLNLDSTLFEESRNINKEMPNFVIRKIINFIEKNNLKNKEIKIYILGFAFKGYPETSDMRGSVSLDILKYLKKKLHNKILYCGYDPVVKKEQIESYGVKYMDLDEGFENADCVLFLNNNPNFEKIDVFSMISKMKKPALFFDGWYKFSARDIMKIDNVEYQGLGGKF
jgi:UDP-N-acetyl-D-mannosaminuronic acid dehydrogenase